MTAIPRFENLGYLLVLHYLSEGRSITDYGAAFLTREGASMKVLFLDIDGVLNCLGDEDGNGVTAEKFQGFIGLDSRLLTIYKAMLSRVNVKVVLSSSWRVFPNLLEYLNERGIYFDDVTLWTDPKLDLLRGHEIQLWLNEYPGVTRYAILDDESDHILDHQRSNFFQTSYETGITQELADRIVAHLMG